MKKMLGSLVPVLFALVVTLGPGIGGQDVMESAATIAERVGLIDNPAITEASGLAASLVNPGLLWVINDSNHAPVLYGVSPDGRTLATCPVVGAVNYDWEDLASFSLDGIPYLMIADVGDNFAVRDHCRLYFVEEPLIPAGGSSQPLPVKSHWQIRFRYEDGPRDCEAVAVDLPGRQILLLSKRDQPPVLYSLPLTEMTRTTGMLTAGKVTTVTTIPPPTPSDMTARYGKFYSRPTAMDISPEDNALVVLTYKHAYVYLKAKGQSWSSALAAWPQMVTLPHPDTGELLIREGICWHPGSGNLFVTSEEAPAPIYYITTDFLRTAD